MKKNFYILFSDKAERRKVNLIIIKSIIILIYILFLSIESFSQGAAINETGASAAPSAILDLSSSTKGLLIPRVALLSVNDITTIPNPAVSLLVYNTNASMTGGGIGFWYFNGTKWVSGMGAVGPTGPTGPTGPIGPTGPAGNQSSSMCKGTVYKYDNGQPYTYTNNSGTYQTVYIKAWGGGGGGNGKETGSNGTGGGGGYAYCKIMMVNGEYLTIRPGGGGKLGGGGGASVVMNHNWDNKDIVLIVAAGGGGAGADGGASGLANANGGAGGGLTGQAGTTQSLVQSPYNEVGRGGAGGTQSGGGAGGTASTAMGQSACNGDAGASMSGGNVHSEPGCSATYKGGKLDIAGETLDNGHGGSGGSGYYGGGGGGSVYSYVGGGGGGGSSFCNVWPSLLLSQTIGGNGQIAGMMQDPCNQGAGLGGNPGENGLDGIVVIYIE